MTRRLIVGLLSAVGVVATVESARAQEIQVTGPLAGAPAVRKLRLHRRGRFELAPVVSFTLLDEYQRTILFGGRLNYNVTDGIALGVWGAVGGIHTTTDLSDKIQSNTNDRYNPNSSLYNSSNPYSSPVSATGRRLTALNVGQNFKEQLGTIQWVIAPQLTATPFRGKLALFQKVFVDTDLYFFAGPAFVGLRERANCPSASVSDCSARVSTNPDGTENNDSPAATKPTATRVAVAPTFGLGLSFYTNRFTSIGLEYRALPFSWNTGGFDTHGGGVDQRFPDNKVDANDREFKFNQMISLSFGFYLPTEIKTSE